MYKTSHPELTPDTAGISASCHLPPATTRLLS